MASPARSLKAGRHTPLDRALFPITRTWKYCNNAAVGPLPKPTRDAVAAVLDAQMNEGCAGILDVESNLESVRSATAKSIGAQSQEIAFLRSTSDGALVVANGLSWRSGDEIVLPDNEFGANAYPWLFLRDLGVRVVFIRAPQRMTVEALERAKTKRTRLVAVSYVSFLDGYRHDLEAIGTWCRDNKILFAVDAMQGFGVLPLDVNRAKIDFCYFGTAKWLLSPQGLSVLFVRRERLDQLRPALCSWRSVKEPMTFLDYAQELSGGASRFEGGTVNYPALIGFAQSLRLLQEAGLEAIERHVLSLCDGLATGASAAGVEVLSSLERGRRSGILLLGLGGCDVELLSRRALEQKVQVTVRTNGVRVSPHGYSTVGDVQAVLELLGALT